jgi:hypothetical protein
MRIKTIVAAATLALVSSSADAGFLYVAMSDGVNDPFIASGPTAVGGQPVSITGEGDFSLSLTAGGYPTPNATLTGPETNLTFSASTETGGSLFAIYYDIEDSLGSYQGTGYDQGFFVSGTGTSLSSNATLTFGGCAGLASSEGSGCDYSFEDGTWVDSTDLLGSVTASLFPGFPGELWINSVDGGTKNFDDQYYTAIWFTLDATGAGTTGGSLTLQAVPAPAPLALLGAGLLAMGCSQRKRKQVSAAG